MMKSDVLIDDRSGQALPDGVSDAVAAAAGAVMELDGFTGSYEVSVSFVGEEEIRDLNRTYRGVDSVTDVLSFPLDETSPGGVRLLGDVVICVPRAVSQSVEYGHSIIREFSYLTVHSILHLLGHDHEDEAGKAAMRKAEKACMDRLGVYRNPSRSPVGPAGAGHEEHEMMNDDFRALTEAAARARQNAYAPYSGYAVGAAVLSDKGLFTGCNVENASYPAGICAERVAAGAAVAAGARVFFAVAVCAPGRPASPCGVCRQFLSEFTQSGAPVHMSGSDGTTQTEKFSDLFPRGFGREDLS